MSGASQRIVLTYLNRGGRAEAIRLCFTVAGVPFEDRRITLEEFQAHQTDHSRFPTEQLPVLEVGAQKFTQAMAILRFAGKLSGLYPFDPKEALAIDEALDHIFDIYKTEPAFYKTAVTSGANNALLGLNSTGNSPVAGGGVGAAFVDGDQNNNNNQRSSRRNSPIPPPPLSENNIGGAGVRVTTPDQNIQGPVNRSRSGSDIPHLGQSQNYQQQQQLAQVLGASMNNNTNNNNKSPLLSPTGGAGPLHGSSAALLNMSFNGDVVAQIKLCFRRVCELINYDTHGASPYIASPRPTIADFAIFCLVRQIKNGNIPHVPPNLLEAPEFAPLYQLVDILEDYPGVKYFYETP